MEQLFFKTDILHGTRLQFSLLHLSVTLHRQGFPRFCWSRKNASRSSEKWTLKLKRWWVSVDGSLTATWTIKYIRPTIIMNTAIDCTPTGQQFIAIQCISYITKFKPVLHEEKHNFTLAYERPWDETREKRTRPLNAPIQSEAVIKVSESDFDSKTLKTASSLLTS